MTGTVLTDDPIDGVRVVTLNRPSRLNAITPELVEDLTGELNRANQDSGIRAIVLTGAGRAFCSGDDLKEFESQRQDAARIPAYVDRIQDVTRAIVFGDTPVIWRGPWLGRRRWIGVGHQLRLCHRRRGFALLLPGLMADIPLDQVSTSYTINASAFVLIGMYEVVCNEQGVAAGKITGTCQNDILKEYTAQNESIYPPADAVRLVVDTMEYAAKTMPRYNPVSVSGYHIRDAGANAVQELAFTLAAGHCYVTEAVKRGLTADSVAPRISFFWNIQNDFFEEICKLRASRRLWARMMREWVGAKDPRSWMMRAHSQTSGVSLTAQQPDNNIARTAIQVLAAILGGTQSLHTNSKDEAFQIPSEGAIKIAVRTQQMLALENRVADIVDPLGGSYYVENLTSRLEEEAEALIRQVLDRGGMVPRRTSARTSSARCGSSSSRDTTTSPSHSRTRSHIRRPPASSSIPRIPTRSMGSPT
jgi:hypothetical protein